jgi:hypothetical protein
MGLSFTVTAGPRQRSHSQIRVPRDSWTHFNVSNSRLPQPAGPGPRVYILQGQGGPVLRYIGSGRNHRKHRFLYCRVLIHCCRRGPSENAACNNSCIPAWHHSVLDAFLCCVCTGHCLKMAVSLPLEFLRWADTPQYCTQASVLSIVAVTIMRVETDYGMSQACPLYRGQCSTLLRYTIHMRICTWTKWHRELPFLYNIGKCRPLVLWLSCSKCNPNSGTDFRVFQIQLLLQTVKVIAGITLHGVKN